MTTKTKQDVRAIVLTSTMRRHQFVANTLATQLDVVGVWQEQKSFEPMKYAASAEDEVVIAGHFTARDEAEDNYFADHDVVRAPARRLPPRGCNDPAEIEAMRRLAPDVVLVFGTSLLSQSLIDAFAGNVINIHLGLSPYYRGAGTNFWPLVNREPEYCGATIHFLDAGVDSGPILAHVRPDIAAGDGPHDIGNKTIVAAVDALASVASAHVTLPLRGLSQEGGGRLYKRADFSADAVRRLYANFETGMIDEYLRDRVRRDAALALVTLGAQARSASPAEEKEVPSR
jgi:folate-dependent phosphoribosylglycinamide formyltransferase PurN